MSKVLEIMNPPIETYQGESFILGILLAYDNTKNIYYNNYINLATSKENNPRDFILRFTNSLWENYRLNGIANMDKCQLKGIPYDNFEDFIMECIDQGKYILLFGIDEYYLSYTDNYYDAHNIHDTYIYGYDEDNFYVMAYSKGHLSRITVDATEILEAVYSRMSSTEDSTFCTFYINESCNIEVDFPMMLNELKNYLMGIDNDTYIEGGASGINIYKELQQYTNYFMTHIYDEILPYDIRIFRELWEHKKIMYDRIELISSSFEIDQNIITSFRSIMDNSKQVFELAMKYKMLNSNSILEKIHIKLSEMEEEEVQLYTQLIDQLEGKLEKKSNR